MKNIEKHCLKAFDEIKKEIPNLGHLTFDTIAFSHSENKVKVSGFLHTGGQCISFGDIPKMQDYIGKIKERRAKNEILYRRF